MERKSSRGNPWHDERGRFCSRDKAKSLKCGNEYVMVSDMEDADKAALNASMSKAAEDADTMEYYKQQTANRSIYADSLSRYTPRGEAAFKENDTPEQREKRRVLQAREQEIAYGLFEKENAAAIRKGAKVTVTVNKETGEASYNVYDARVIVNQATKGYQTKDGRLYKDTSTNMRTSEGYVVTADADDDKVRGSHANASKEEMQQSLTAYIEAHKEELAEKNKHICVWMHHYTDKEGKPAKRLLYTIATWHKDKQEAVTESNKRLKSTVANCSTGERVQRNKTIVEAEQKYQYVKDSTTGSVSLKSGEFAVGNKENGGVQWTGSEFIDTTTGEVLGKKQVWARARGERDRIRNLLTRGQQNVVKRN